MMHRFIRKTMLSGMIAMVTVFTAVSAQAAHPINDPPAENDNLILESASATLKPDGTIVFKQTVAGQAGETPITQFGLNGAAVLGYVFPTSLNSADIGFGPDLGTVALAITQHPDFDDTPNADENGNGDMGDDGAEPHSHWVVLVPSDTQYNGVAVNLAVKPLDLGDPSVTKPTTHPGAPFAIHIDSPDFAVSTDGGMIQVDVPPLALPGGTEFTFSALTAFLEVHGTAPNTDNDPLLGVYKVYSSTDGGFVPEPASAMVLGLGLLGFASRRIRRTTSTA